jgi:hypothetical protein
MQEVKCAGGSSRELGRQEAESSFRGAGKPRTRNPDACASVRLWIPDSLALLEVDLSHDLRQRAAVDLYLERTRAGRGKGANLVTPTK